MYGLKQHHWLTPRCYAGQLWCCRMEWLRSLPSFPHSAMPSLQWRCQLLVELSHMSIWCSVNSQPGTKSPSRQVQYVMILNTRSTDAQCTVQLLSFHFRSLWTAVLLQWHFSHVTEVSIECTKIWRYWNREKITCFKRWLSSLWRGGCTCGTNCPTCKCS